MTQRDTAAFVEIFCPVCNETKGKPLFSIDHRLSTVLSKLDLSHLDRKVDIIHCNCGHKYMSPVIAQDLMNKYYSLNSEFYSEEYGTTFEMEASKNELYRKWLALEKPVGKVLEIGCGKGFLLKTLETAGYDCYGVEPSPLAHKHATEVLHLNVKNEFFSENTFEGIRFDVIILMDVMEHIFNADEFIKTIKSVLKEDGVLMFGTGNIDSLTARIAGKNWGYFVSWEHVSFFTEKSIHKLLTDNGFKDIKVKELSHQLKPLQNISEFSKNLLKKVINPFLSREYYHGLCYDHFIVTAKKK